MGRPSTYAPELRERAVRMVFDHVAGHSSQCEILKKAAAFVPQAELDRGAKWWSPSSSRTGRATESSRSVRSWMTRVGRMEFA